MAANLDLSTVKLRRHYQDRFDNDPALITRHYSEVRGADFESLLSGRILAIRALDFFSPTIAYKAAEQIAVCSELSYYSNAAMIAKVGLAYFETIDGELSKREYFERAATFQKQVDAFFYPDSSPAERMRAFLDRSWPFGCRVLRNNIGNEFFYGLLRIFKGSEAITHVDRIEWDDHTINQPLAQIALNTYIGIPDDGGELALWNFSPSKEFYESAGKAYGIDESLLQRAPDLTIAPSIGELIVFDSRRLHAVRKGVGTRITCSCFALLFDSKGPLYIYS
jgi:hypothetical protein